MSKIKRMVLNTVYEVLLFMGLLRVPRAISSVTYMTGDSYVNMLGTKVRMT
jgi:hypothetical protein